ncbi:MAG: FAD-dependent thymidylate synthase [Ignisphaera sp.]|uniref:FAD-dependent thymidylate synthase n=1 Tax=Ignisphaera aggregans TaxID=334771 RepID=A0A7C4D1K3_9CREN
MIKVELLDYTKDGEKLIALSFKKSLYLQKISDEEIEKLITETIKRGYWSLWELSNYVFEIECSNICIHHFTKSSYIHQTILRDLLNDLGNMLGKPCEELNYSCHIINLNEFEKKLEDTRNQVEEYNLLSIIEKYFYIPSSIKQNKELYNEYISYIISSIKIYLFMLMMAIPHEDAEYVLPQSINSRLIIQMNARELATVFIPNGTCAQTQKEARSIAWRILLKLESIHPKLFSFIGPKCILIENMVRDQLLKIRDVINPETRVEFTIDRCPYGVNREDIRTCVIKSFENALNL